MAAGTEVAAGIHNRPAAAGRNGPANEDHAATHIRESQDPAEPPEAQRGPGFGGSGFDCDHVRAPDRLEQEGTAVEAGSSAETAAVGSVAAAAANVARLASEGLAQPRFRAAIADLVAVQQVEIGLATQSFDPFPLKHPGKVPSDGSACAAGI